MPAGDAVPERLTAEGQRVMGICNACRYCEGYCAVFPALQRRLAFSAADLGYLANLCHNCGACYTSCQYAPPHEFALNLPRTLAEIRIETYVGSAWPPLLGRLFRHGVSAAVLATLAFVALFVAGVLVAQPGALAAPRASFYDVIPHRVMALSFGAAGLFVVVALGAAFLRFWRRMGERFGALLGARSIVRAIADSLFLVNLGGGGEGCASATEAPSTVRRRFHHLTTYGFALCFASTVVATYYHYVLGRPAPYPVASVPVMLGIAGGLGLIVGPAGLWWLRERRDPALADPRQSGLDRSFLVLLFLTSLSGMLLLSLRETAAMGLLLALHLGIVMGLFVTLPCGKFVHAIHRLAALLRSALERSRPQAPVGVE